MLCASPAGAWANDAEILNLQGLGDRRAAEAAGWEAAQPRQRVAPGGYVRTREAARMALLLSDQTQLRLNQNTVLQVKAVGQQGSGTRLQLDAGRAWTQTRNVGGQGVLTVDTPAATAAIRGTDWELEVGPDGRTQLTVLSGVVTLSNAQGSLEVGRNEAALAEVGKAPVRLLLSNPRDRVQWVQALAADPLRHLDASALADADAPLLRQAAQDALAGRDDLARPTLQALLARRGADAPVATHLMLADLQLVAGDFGGARATLEAALARHPGQPELLALLSRSLLLADQTEASAQALASYQGGPDAHIALARGDLARRQGQATQALAAYTEASTLAPQDTLAWRSLGSAQGEREDFGPARQALARALALVATDSATLGELATVQTQANRLDEAERLFQQALQQQPGDYLAQTGLGLLRLKQGRPQEALDALLRAGVMEPRYSRALSHTAVAYYQLGRHADALAFLQRAIEQDNKDPVPHLLLAQIHTDLFQPDEAVQAARAAVARLPYLKSLNQVANDQKGSANFGASLAFFGLEDWALELAHQSDYPYWGGSHLFLADRYPGEFQKNSRLFQGYLTDPLSFGASPGFSSLLQRAGQYGTLGLTVDSEFADMVAPYAIANGLFNDGFPVSLFGKLQHLDGRHFPIDISGSNFPTQFDGSGRARLRADVATLGLGLQPTDRLNLFVYGNRFTAALRGANQVFDLEGGLSGSQLDHQVGQGVLGAAFRWAPQSQTWLKLGRSSERTLLQNFPVAFIEQDFGGVLGMNAEPTKRLSDLQLRHTTDLDPHTRVSFGWEHTRESQYSEVVAYGPVVALANGDLRTDRMLFAGNNRIERRLQVLDAVVQHQALPGLRLDGALAFNHLREHIQGQSAVVLLDSQQVGEVPATEQRQTERRWTPRLGLAWQPDARWSLRAAYQDWVRPIGVNTLAPVETAGLAADDRLVQAGGRSRSLALQAAHSPDERSFLLARLDLQRVRNPGTLGVDLRTPSLPFLSELRNAQIDNLSANDVLEDDPDFERARLRQLSLGASRMLDRRWSVYAKWVRALGSSTAVLSGQTVEGLRIPYVPRDRLALGATWAGGQRVYLSGRMVWRGLRYEDESNLTPLPAGWSLDLMGFWESPDKRLQIGLAALNLLGPKAARKTQRYVIDARLRF
jgi:tetratricopeptide (TPR) repeat protein